MKINKKYLNRPLKWLHQRAWDLQSKCIRLKGSRNGYNQCIACGRWYPINELHAGHYLHNCLDFDLRNIWPECVKCNYFESGNRDNYLIRLQMIYGPNIRDKLLVAKKLEKKRTKVEYIAMIQEFEKWYKELTNR